jgi:methionyl-tRNA formyltransferase
LFRARLLESEQQKEKPGLLVNVTPHGLALATGMGSVLIGEVQLEGKRRMLAADFVRGMRIAPRAVLENG